MTHGWVNSTTEKNLNIQHTHSIIGNNVNVAQVRNHDFACCLNYKPF